MKNLFRTLSKILPVAGLLAACGLLPGVKVITGSGNVTSQDRPVSGFTGVALDGSGEVVITQGATEGLTIEAEDNLLPLITSEVKDGVLRLDFSRADWRDIVKPTKPIRFLVAVKDLSALDLAGSGSLRAGSLQSPNMKITLSGSGDVTLDDLQGQALNATLNGSGNVTAGGQIQKLDLLLSGSGQVMAGNLESQAASVSVSGSGDVTIWVREQLDVAISGSGTVNYFGTPTIGQRDITGSGDINPMGDK
ncbi:MAG: head GIN domain-containing protein [Anaerolineales bacterium]